MISSHMRTLDRRLLGLAGFLSVFVLVAVGAYGFVVDALWTAEDVGTPVIATLAVAVGFVAVLSVVAIGVSHRVETSYW